MTAVPPAVAAMAALLAEEIREVESFLVLLHEEQGLLTTPGKIDSLMPLAERKADFAGRLKALADQREQILAAAGFENGRAGMETWLARTPGAAALSPRWQKLLSAARQTRAQNETNGKLIEIHLQHNQAALAALMSAADRAMTYGADGQQQCGGGGRILGSA